MIKLTFIIISFYAGYYIRTAIPVILGVITMGFRERACDCGAGAYYNSQCH